MTPTLNSQIYLDDGKLYDSNNQINQADQEYDLISKHNNPARANVNR